MSENDLGQQYALYKLDELKDEYKRLMRLRSDLIDNYDDSPEMTRSISMLEDKITSVMDMASRLMGQP